MGQAHGVSSSTHVTSDDARQVARVMAGLGTASRVRILARLREGACSVTELTEAVEMAQPASERHSHEHVHEVGQEEDHKHPHA